MSIIVRRMTLSDVKDVSEIEAKSFATPWSPDAFEQEIRDNKLAVYYVAEEHDRVVGYAGFWDVVGELHITNVAVSPEKRGKGIGDLLMEALVQHASSGDYIALTLEVRVTNTVAINLYKKFGFVSMGVRRGYYTDTKEDAMIMWKEISK